MDRKPSIVPDSWIWQTESLWDLVWDVHVGKVSRCERLPGLCGEAVRRGKKGREGCWFLICLERWLLLRQGARIVTCKIPLVHWSSYWHFNIHLLRWRQSSLTSLSHCSALVGRDD